MTSGQYLLHFLSFLSIRHRKIPIVETGVLTLLQQVCVPVKFSLDTSEWHQTNLNVNREYNKFK